MRFAIYRSKSANGVGHSKARVKRNLSETLRLCMLLEREGGEVNAGSEDLCFGENADTPDAIDVHFDVRITVRIAEVGKVGSPGRVFCIAFDNYGVLVKSIGESEGGFGFLPRIEIVRLFASEPVGQWSPHI